MGQMGQMGVLNEFDLNEGHEILSSWALSRAAECHSATQQSATLRYEVRVYPHFESRHSSAHLTI
jgi:hypothetical protein